MNESNPTAPVDGAGVLAPEPSRPAPPLSFRERVEVLIAPEQRRAGVAVAAVVAVAVVAAVLVARGGAPPPPEISMPLAGGPGDPAATTTTVPAVLLVHAAGAVASPGVYELRVGARVADIVDAAGGPAPGADLDRLNLAAPLADGQQVYVPRQGEAVPAGATGVAGESVDALVDLNTATTAELEDLPGVGPALARAIVEERERRGGFGAVDELLEVRGIGPAKLEQLRDLVTV